MTEIPLKSLDLPERFFEELEAGLEISRKGFLSSTMMDEENYSLRSTEDAKLLLGVFKSILKDLKKLLTDYPSLDSLFERSFGPVGEMVSREAIIEMCLVDLFLFPHRENYPLLVDGVFSSDLALSYQETFKAWCGQKKLEHEKTQDQVKNKFDLKLQSQDLKCQCIQCLGDYRTRLRETVFDQQTALIDQNEERLFELVLMRPISDIANRVFDLKKNLDKGINQVRHKFKRSSLNKLESEIKAHFRSKFSINSQLGKVYREKLMAYFNSILVDQGFKPELVSPEEYERFFMQLETNIWKPESFLSKEFERFIKAILALKRKDVSSGILREYLGQFWLHAEARKMNRHFVYHMGPTNSGKTYHAIERLCQAKKGSYLAPLRLLASELYDTMNNKGVKTTLLTGEEVVEVKDATHISSTIEMARLHEEFDCCVIDEIQMLTDPQRGWAWTRALIGLMSKEIHLCGDHTVLELVKKILSMTGDTLEVKEYKRMTELKIMEHPITLSELERGDALIVFSRRNALKYKADLENLDFKVSIVYGRLSPEVRREQARKFDMGETDIMVSTDAIAMGMNLPVQRIVFSALAKFVEEKEQPLTPSEIKQISGRAGRFKRFPVGYVTTLTRVEHGISILEEAIKFHLPQSERAMVGPDLEIYNSVNQALESHSLPVLTLSEFLRLFNTMTFSKPFYCTDLKEMIELAEMVEGADENKILTTAEVFGFACAPVNLGLVEHVQYYLWILNHYAKEQDVVAESIDVSNNDIDYLETAIKCVELFQWLSRHFDEKHFSFDEKKLLENKIQAVEKLNMLLSEKTTKKCSSCGCKLPTNTRFAICDACFNQRKKARYRPHHDERSSETSEAQPHHSHRDGKRPAKKWHPKGGQKGGKKSGAQKNSTSKDKPSEVFKRFR
jgi:ATP-dependent RNA helicase SUPV3L1/SUV3